MLCCITNFNFRIQLEDDDNRHSTAEKHHYYLAEQVWIDEQHPYVDLDEMKKMQPNSVKEHHMLAMSHTRVATIHLNFRFVEISR